MKKYLSKRLLSLVLVLALLCGLAAPAGAFAAADESRQDLVFEKLDSSTGSGLLAEAEVDQEVLEHTAMYEDTDVVRVSIVLEEPSTIMAGYSTERIASNAEAMAYRDSLKEEQVSLTARIEKAIGEPLDVHWNLTLAANIISANVEYGQISAIEAIDGVAEVVVEVRYAPDVAEQGGADPNMSTSESMIGSSVAWAGGYTGAGSRIAIIDTGVDTDHQSFSSQGFQASLAYQAGLSGMDLDEYLDSLNLLDAEEIASVADQLNIKQDYTAEDLYINAKIPFGYNYVDINNNVTHDYDSQGAHGSHVAGIAAANAYVVTEDGGYTSALRQTNVQGVAPDAQIIAMKVFGVNGGAYESDYMAAIEDAIILGCDSVNLSLGTAMPGFTRSDTYAELLEMLEETSTVVCTSAGNNYTWAEYASPIGYLHADDVSLASGGAPGTYTNVLSSASVDNVGSTGLYISSGDSLIFYTEYLGFGNEQIVTLAGEREYILIDGVGTEEEFAALADVLEGKIAVCSRGTNSFYQKCNAAIANGAVATIIYNNQPGSINMDLTGYRYTAPAVSVTTVDGQILRANAAAVTGEDGDVVYYQGTLTISDTVGTAMGDSDYYTMSAFSSWGVPGSLELKPEITAPGGSIYSVDGSVVSGDGYTNMSGTSMASPQTAGMVAVLAQYIRENGLAEDTGLTTRQLAQSLLMSTAEPIVEEDTGLYYSVLNQGSGLANVGNALNASSYILMDDQANAGASDGKVKVELGDDPAKTGSYSFSFTLNNISDSDKTYTMGSSLFTQDLFEYEGELWLDTWTTALSAAVTYTVDGEIFVPTAKIGCDLNSDGVTDAQDAQIILEYTVGAADSIDGIADVNADGSVTTYDAWLILDSLVTREFTVAAGSAAQITVSIDLTADAKAYLDAYYENGAYVEGYVFVNPTVSAEGAVEDVTHSIPVLGFYGNWSQPSMYDRSTVVDYYYGTAETPYTGATKVNNVVVRHTGDSTLYYSLGNNYFIEDEYPADRLAVSSTTSFYSYLVSLIRNAAGLITVITDEDGEVLYCSNAFTQNSGAFYYSSAGSWYYNASHAPINKRVSTLGVSEGEKITVTVISVPEYYENGAALTSDEILELYNSGILGEGASMSTTYTVDNTAPAADAIYLDALSDEMVVVATDNEYIAGVMVYSADGSVYYGGGVPEQTAANQTSSISFDLSSLDDAQIMVVVADYANNESSYLVQIGEAAGEEEEDVDYSGRMFGFTSDNYRGTGYRWMEIHDDEVYFVNSSNYGGSENLDEMPFKVLAAEYLQGYVFMAAIDGNFYVADQGDWADYKYVARWKDEEGLTNVYDMAYSYADNTMYFMANDNTIWSIEVVSGEMTRLYTVSVTNPAYANARGYLRCLAIDDSGNFYSSNADTTKTRNFLYTWTNSMVEDGAITELAPAFDTSYNYLNSYSYEYSMAWDHDNDVLWMSTGYSSSTNVYLLQIDVTTGQASVAYSSAATYPGRFGANLSALYIVPASGTSIPTTTQPTGISVSQESMTIYRGESSSLKASLTPWTLDDHSVTWSSSDESIVTVEQDGSLTGTGVGVAQVIATSNADPSYAASCTVTVEEYDVISLTGLIRDESGKLFWADFSSDDLDGWTTVAEADGDFLGGYYDPAADIIYAHDNSYLYTVDADLLTSKELSYIDSTWIWSDIAYSEPASDGSLGRAVALSNNGCYLTMLDMETLTLEYVNLYYYHVDDHMAVIAYKGNADRGQYPANYYYMITESGVLWELCIFNFNGTASLNRTQIGQLDLNLADVSHKSGVTASLLYDEESGKLILSADGGDGAHLYVIDPSDLSIIDLGSFGEGTQVGSMYSYDRITELTVRLDAESAQVYENNTIQIGVKVRPSIYDKGVIWTSSDETIATVDQNGNVSGIKPGTVTITATSVDVNEAGETVSDSCTVEVLGYYKVDLDFGMQVTDENGSANWVTFNGTDIHSLTTVASNVTPVLGATGYDGTIYASTESGVFTIDTETYEETDPVALSVGTVYDLDYIPSMVNNKGIEIFGNLSIATGTHAYLLNTDLATTYNAWNLLCMFYLDPIATAYVKESTYIGSTAATVAFLTESGDLYLANTYSTNGTSYANDNVYSAYGNVGIDFTGKDVTMDYVSHGDTEGFIICDGITMYYVDLETLTLHLMGDLDVTGATGLYVLNNPAAEEAEEGNGTELIRTATDSTFSSSLVLWAAPMTGEETATTQSVESEIAEEGVELTLTETEDSTNGLLKVTYDPAVLAYESIVSTADVTAVDVDAQKGVITFAYASAAAIMAGDTIAVVNFTYASSYADTTVTIETLQRNGEVISETVTVDVLIEIGGHSYELTDSTAATCTEDGCEVYTCSKCGDRYTTILPTTGHSWNEGEVTEEATCTGEGVITYTCGHCGETYTESIPAAGHSWNEGEVTKEATCTEEGVITYTCLHCGETYTESIPVIGCPSAAFADVETESWYHPYVDYVVGHEIMNGVSDTAFAPSGTMNRAMMVTVLYRMAGSPTAEGTAPFADVEEGAWYADAVLWAYENGIAMGVSGTAFAPSAPVTREQTAAFLMRYADNVLGLDTSARADLSSFTDSAEISGYAVDAMAWAVASELFQGYPDGTLQPGTTLNRAEMAKLLTIVDSTF